MSITKFNPLSIVMSVLALSGILSHGVQAETLVAESSASEHRQNLLSTGKHIHIDTGTYGNSTHDLRAQTPATRPRDEDDKNQTVKKRFGGDGFGNDFSSATNL